MNKTIQNIFSIKNNLSQTHKVITLCGVKLKIKSKKIKPYKTINSEIDYELGCRNFENKFSYVLPLNTIKEIIKNPAIKVVSFDIFDTLLYRPCIHPSDIFYLIAISSVFPCLCS